MPPGYVHKHAHTLGVCVVLPFAAVMAFAEPVLGTSIAAGYLLGRVVEPDLDQISITSSEGIMLRRFGCLGALWVMYWFPYSWVMPHRSVASHFPGISTAVRMLYLFWPILMLLAYTQSFDEVAALVTFGVFVGLSLSDAIHWALDFSGLWRS